MDIRAHTGIRSVNANAFGSHNPPMAMNTGDLRILFSFCFLRSKCPETLKTHSKTKKSKKYH